MLPDHIDVNDQRRLEKVVLEWQDLEGREPLFGLDVNDRRVREVEVVPRTWRWAPTCRASARYLASPHHLLPPPLIPPLVSGYTLLPVATHTSGRSYVQLRRHRRLSALMR